MLLCAAARGVPVVATEACGLEGVPGVRILVEPDAAALRDAILAALAHPGVLPARDARVRA